MAATASEVLTGLKNRLATISGLKTFSYQPANIVPPLAYPVITQVNYHRAMGGGLVVFDCVVYVIVGRWTDDRANADIDDYLAFSGTKSIRAAIEGDETLGGKAQSLTVASSTDITALQQGDAEYLQIATQVTVNG
jgi:hypothetical protein